MIGLMWRGVRYESDTVNVTFVRSSIAFLALMSFSHGVNDAQKTMGIMTLASFSAGYIADFAVPLWVMGDRGTGDGRRHFGGGNGELSRQWVTRSIKLEPIYGFAAETVAASVIESRATWPSG